MFGGLLVFLVSFIGLAMGHKQLIVVVSAVINTILIILLMLQRKKFYECEEDSVEKSKILTNLVWLSFAILGLFSISINIGLFYGPF